MYVYIEKCTWDSTPIPNYLSIPHVFGRTWSWLPQDNMVMVAGEITTQAKLDYEKVPVFLYREMGMGYPSYFCSSLEKIIRIYTQSNQWYVLLFYIWLKGSVLKMLILTKENPSIFQSRESTIWDVIIGPKSFTDIRQEQHLRPLRAGLLYSETWIFVSILFFRWVFYNSI